MLLHEHLNYFDIESLGNVVRAAGFEPLLLEPARHGGVLFCCAIPKSNRLGTVASIKTDEKFQVFRAKAESALRRFAGLAENFGGGELGLYVPIRAFPYLAQLPIGIQLRFFDDNLGLRGCFYDGFSTVIENQDDLVERPPELVIVCSLAFGDVIAERLLEKQVNGLRIVKWSELFE